MDYGNDINSIAKYETLYTICDQCESNGVPNQKIIVVYLRITPASEPGFIHRLLEFDYPGRRQKLHKHKYKKEIIDRLVDEIFSRTGRVIQ